MKAFVLGAGGREHAIAWRLSQSPSIERVYAAPGNAGLAFDLSCIPADLTAPQELAALAETLDVDFTIVGPEAPLVAGVVDAFEARGLPIVGPCRFAAQLEGSKVFAKDFFQKYGIPTARSRTVDSTDQLAAAVDEIGPAVALKADGLAAGKGVILAHSRAEALDAGRLLLSGEAVGEAGRRILVEELLVGREVSFIVLTDGKRLFELRPTQDHKAAYDGDQGPNTGGMGAYCDDSILDPDLRQAIVDTIIQPALDGMKSEGSVFRGFLYAGLMITADGPKTLEFNVRLGDPETQPLLYRLDGDFGELMASAARRSLDASVVSWKPGATTCVVMASEGYPGAYPKGRPISGIGDAEATGAKVFHAGTAFRKGRLATSGGRVLGVTAGGDTLEASLQAAYAAVECISFEGAHYRRDIGRRPRA
ncbi:MAG: phosphoribosylamine--glycine ligase [Acidobacteria bacterium]|nr:phosphoribosylamine--glycine ligase [Acidobacteriota bacterium]